MRITKQSLSLLLPTLFCTLTAMAEDVPMFFDPAEDPIPYNPSSNLHGSAYELPDAPWKREADKRIDQYRKADLMLGVVDKNGKRLSGVPVHVELVKHDFYWGAIFYSDFLSSPNCEKVTPYFLKYFNSAGASMGFKPSPCPIPSCQQSGQSGHFYKGEKLQQWLQQHDMPVRGHTLAWEGPRFLAKDLQTIYNDPDLSDAEKGKHIFKRKVAHVKHAAEKWDVFCWDVVNEPRVNHCIDELLPETNTLVEYFRQADQVRKNTERDFLMYYNENQVASFVRKDSSFEEYAVLYKTRIQEVLDAGIQLDGIGMQYRFRREVAPEEVYRRLCHYEEFNLPYQATEFEIKPMTPEEPFSIEDKKRLTAEYLTLFFSHPNATGLWHWSFMDDKNGRLPDALFSHEGEARPEMEQWIKMMEEDFNTDETLTTSKKGIAHVRGFKGLYKITVGMGSKTVTSIIELKEDHTVKIVY